MHVPHSTSRQGGTPNFWGFTVGNSLPPPPHSSDGGGRPFGRRKGQPWETPKRVPRPCTRTSPTKPTIGPDNRPRLQPDVKSTHLALRVRRSRRTPPPSHIPVTPSSLGAPSQINTATTLSPPPTLRPRLPPVSGIMGATDFFSVSCDLASGS